MVRVESRGSGRIAHVIEVAFCYDPKRANGGEHPAVFAVQLTQALSLVLDQLSFEAVRQVQPVHERVTRIAVAVRASRSQLAPVLLAVPPVVVPPRTIYGVVVPGSLSRSRR